LHTKFTVYGDNNISCHNWLAPYGPQGGVMPNIGKISEFSRYVPPKKVSLNSRFVISACVLQMHSGRTVTQNLD